MKKLFALGVMLLTCGAVDAQLPPIEIRPEVKIEPKIPSEIKTTMEVHLIRTRVPWRAWHRFHGHFHRPILLPRRGALINNGQINIGR